MKLSRKSSRLQQLKTKMQARKALKLYCCICDKEIRQKYVEDAWNNKAHAEHELHYCCCCDRIISVKSSNRGVFYKDGRVICGVCTGQALLIPQQAQESKKRVLQTLTQLGFSGIPSNIELEMGQLNKTQVLAGASYKAGETQTQVHQQNQQRQMLHKIKVLFGVPKVEFEAILAHELLHVWQHQKQIKLAPDLCEGLCELGAWQVYHQEGTEFSKFKIEKMFKNPDPVYGEGFRIMKAKLDLLGWKDLIGELLGIKNDEPAKLPLSQKSEGSWMKRIFGKYWG